MLFYAAYDCIYSAEGENIPTNGEDVKKFSIPLGHYACFGGIYSNIRRYKKSVVTYHIYLYKDNLVEKNYNLCTKAETKKILRCLQKTVPFTYYFTESQYKLSGFSYKKVDYYVLNITIEGNPTQHIWITSMLRCFFEWPYNVAAKEACELQSTYQEADIDIQKTSWINLYLTIASLLGSTSLHGVVDINHSPKLRSYHDWKQLFASSNDTSVMHLITKSGRRMKNTSIHRISNEDDYNSEEDKKVRVKKYVSAYKDKKLWKR